MGVGGQRHAPAALPPGKRPGIHCIGRCRSGRVRRKSPPPGFDPRTVQPVASRCTDWIIPVQSPQLNKGNTSDHLREPQDQAVLIMDYETIQGNRYCEWVSITSRERQDRLENQSKDGPATIESFLNADDKLKNTFQGCGAIRLCDLGKTTLQKKNWTTPIVSSNWQSITTAKPQTLIALYLCHIFF